MATADAERRGAETRAAEAQTRLARTQRALDQAKADHAALGPQTNPKGAEAKARFDQALAALRDARAALEAAETHRGAAAAAEIAARDSARKAEDQLGRLKTEARGLAQLTAPPAKTALAPVLDQVAAKEGFEAALAAALGDDLNAALDAKAPAYWAGRDDAGAPVWPAGVEPLAPLIQAPAELAARLAHTGLVARKDGLRLQAALPVGARLVSREGDLWRWDGFVARAEAPRPAAVRLEQRRRLAELEAEIEKLAPAATEAAKAHAGSVKALQAADEALRAARREPEAADRALGVAREEMDRHGRESARREAQAQSLSDTIARFDAERLEAEAALAVALAAEQALETDEAAVALLAEARAASRRRPRSRRRRPRHAGYRNPRAGRLRRPAGEPAARPCRLGPPGRRRGQTRGDPGQGPDPRRGQP